MGKSPEIPSAGAPGEYHRARRRDAFLRARAFDAEKLEGRVHAGEYP